MRKGRKEGSKGGRKERAGRRRRRRAKIFRGFPSLSERKKESFITLSALKSPRLEHLVGMTLV